MCCAAPAQFRLKMRIEMQAINYLSIVRFCVCVFFFVLTLKVTKHKAIWKQVMGYHTAKRAAPRARKGLESTYWLVLVRKEKVMRELSLRTVWKPPGLYFIPIYWHIYRYKEVIATKSRLKSGTLTSEMSTAGTTHGQQCRKRSRAWN